MTNALDAVRMRQMLNTIRENISYVGSEYAADDFESELVRESLKNQTGDYLDGLVNSGMIQDYAVVCDDSNNTPVTIDRNELKVDIFIKPIASVSQILMPLIAKIEPMVIAQDIAGVQPMTGPVGEIFNIEIPIEALANDLAALPEPSNSQIVGTGRIKNHPTGPTVLNLPTGPKISL